MGTDREAGYRISYIWFSKSRMQLSDQISVTRWIPTKYPVFLKKEKMTSSQTPLYKYPGLRLPDIRFPINRHAHRHRQRQPVRAGQEMSSKFSNQHMPHVLCVFCWTRPGWR